MEDRITLTRLEVSDASFILQLLNTEGWLRFIGDRNVHSIEDAVAYISRINAASTILYWVVRLNETQQPIGVVTFLKRDYLEHWDIGFAFLPEYNNQGYAFEAADKLLSLMRKNGLHSTVLATTLPDNISSIKLLTKMSFVFDKTIEHDGLTLAVYRQSASGG